MRLMRSAAVLSATALLLMVVLCTGYALAARRPVATYVMRT
jgi:hypothetical protein